MKRNDEESSNNNNDQKKNNKTVSTWGRWALIGCRLKKKKKTNQWMDGRRNGSRVHSIKNDVTWDPKREINNKKWVIPFYLNRFLIGRRLMGSESFVERIFFFCTSFFLSFSFFSFFLSFGRALRPSRVTFHCYVVVTGFQFLCYTHTHTHTLALSLFFFVNQRNTS